MMAFNLGIAAGGAAQGIQNGAQVYSQAVAIQQRNQLIQLEKQKQNIAGYSAFNKMLQTMNPDTMKTLGPNIMKNVLGMDPTDAGAKATYQSMIDPTSQVGKAVRDTFSAMSGDPNDPISGMMKNIPIQSWAKMAQDPSQLTDMMIQLNNYKMMRAAQQDMMGGGTTPPAAPTGGAPAEPVQSQVLSNANAGVGGGNGTNGAASAAPPMAIPMGGGTAPPMGTAPAGAPANGGGAGLSALAGADPNSVAATVTALRKRAMLMSFNPMMKDVAGTMLTSADTLEKNYIGQQQANTQFINAATERAKSSYGAPEPQTPEQQANGITIYKNKLGDPKVVADNPAKQAYYDNLAKASSTHFDEINQNAEMAQTRLGQINTNRALINGGDKTAPPTGTFEFAQYGIGKMLNSLNIPGFQGVLKNASTSEAVDAVLAQIAGPMASQLRSMGGVSATALKQVEESLPQLAYTKEGQNMILDIMQRGAENSIGVQKIWSQHQAAGNPPFMPDQNGKTAEDKTIEFLGGQSGVPPSLKGRLDVMSGKQPVTTSGRTSAVTPSNTNSIISNALKSAVATGKMERSMGESVARQLGLIQ